MKTKLVTYEIHYCNARCSQFYHNYEDNENIWCASLKKKIFNADKNIDVFNDRVEREFPEDCPLSDA